ncbi:MAG TPA: oligosaccharide flippase family protein [Acidimicrobiales bacterium]|nr:oligosaccharide flippase family protein [Acidimicrobiales bacterium]
MVEVRTDARAAGRGAIAIVATQSLSRLLLLAFIIVSARRVGPDQFSRYATVAALLVVCGFIVDFGTTSATTKLVSAGHDSDRVLRDSLTACGLLGLLGYAVGILLAALIGRSTSAIIDFVVGGFFLPAEGITTSLAGALDGRGLITQRSIVSLIRIGLGPMIGIVVILWTYNIRLAMVGLAIGPCVAMVVAIFITHRYQVWSLHARLNPLAGRSLIRQAIPFAVIVGASATLARIDVLILSAISTKTETADYNLALRAVEALQYPLWAMLGPALYLFSKRLAAKDVDGAVRAYQVVAKAFFAMSLPLAAGMVVLGHQVILTIFGQAYSGAGTPVVILSAGLWLTYVIGLGGMFVTSFPNMRPVVIMIVLVDSAAIVVQMPFIFQWGAIGASIGLLLGELLTAVVQIIFVRRTLHVWLPAVPPWRLVVSAVACGGVAWWLRPVSLPLAIVAGGLTYLVAVIVIRGLTKAEAESFVALIRR